jgi:hypothetical protein
MKQECGILMPMDKYRGISLHRDLVGAIEEYINTHPEMGYKSLADFATDAIREKCEKLGIFLPKPALPVLEHFNLGEGGVRVLDRSLANRSSSGKVIDIYFKPEGIWCSHCQADSCRHIDFALSVPSIQSVVVKKQQEGWKLPAITE